MKKVLRRTGLSMFLIQLILVTNAQKNEPKSAEERATQLTEWMKTNLQLTDDQTPKVQDINLRYANKMEELKSSTGARKQKMSQLKDDDAAKDAELKSVLNDNQFQMYQAKKNELKKKFKEKMKEKKSS